MACSAGLVAFNVEELSSEKREGLEDGGGGGSGHGAHSERHFSWSEPAPCACTA